MDVIEIFNSSEVKNWLLSYTVLNHLPLHLLDVSIEQITPQKTNIKGKLKPINTSQMLFKGLIYYFAREGSFS